MKSYRFVYEIRGSRCETVIEAVNVDEAEEILLCEELVDVDCDEVAIVDCTEEN